MAIAIIGAAAAVAGAGAATYGAMSSSANARASNAVQRQNIALAREQNTTNTLRDILAGQQNTQQQILDNQRYDVAVGKEDAQRALINKLATATQRDAQGNVTQYDPLTGTWTQQQTGLAGVNAARGITENAGQYDQALRDRLIGGMQRTARMNDTARIQGTQRAAGESMLNEYLQNRGRTPEQLTGAMIESNVAEVTDPLKRGGDMAMLAGYRQGNSGNDALMGALARQSGGGTRAAIARARLDGPLSSMNEQDARTKSLLQPATTLIGNGTANPGETPVQFNGDTSSNLQASFQRGNPAGTNTSLNPIRGMQQVTNSGRLGFPEYKPLNADGNQAVNLAGAFKGLTNDPSVQALGAKLANWWNPPTDASPYRPGDAGDPNRA